MAGRSPVATKTNMKAVELEEDDCGEEWIDYPFHRIVQPNDHDVLILSKKNSSWEDEELADHPGNVRFQTLLEQHASEYREKSKIEKPVVAANILSSWRSMDPPGRFLKLDSETNLWNDIGAKKSREKISALLKSQFGSCSELLQTEEDKQGGGRETPAALPGDKFKLEHVGPGTTSGIKKESFARQEKRISAKLDCVNDQNRLYGREKETQELIGVFRRHTEGSSSEAKEMCLISGAGGVGKTALAYSLRSHVEQQSGLFIQGKLERKSIHESFDVFVLAMADFAYQITSTEGTAEIDKYRAIFSETFGTQELKILLAIVPALCVIVEALPIDDGGPAEIEKGLHTAKMLTNIFQRFLQVIAKPESPVVLLFEDLHWASEASMELIATLIADVENRSVFFIATATDDLDDAMPSQRRLDHLVANLRSKHIRASSFSLEPLDKVAICEMLGDKLSIAQDQAEVLSKIVFSLTGGNMLFTREVLRKLQEDELVWFDDKRMEWKFDSHLIRSTVEVKDVHDLLKKRLLDISASARETLMAASCLGSVVDESLLSKAFSFSVSSCLQEAAVKGLLVLDQCTGSFCFAHDAAQQAAYSLIPEAEREAFHDRLGRKLWRKLDEKELDEHIFVVLDQLMVQGNTREGETVTVASYCLRAGEKAFRMSMFLKASAYLDYGIAQLGNRGWRDNYALSLKLHEAAAEVSCCIAQYDKVELLVKMIYAESRSFEDSLTARATFIHSLGILGRPVDALESALGTLRKMNESLPSYPSGFQVVKTLWKTKIMLRKRSDGSLLRLPLMTDRQKLATMQILSAVLLHALYVRPSLLPLLACRMVALTLDSGLCAASSVGFAYYGMVLCSGGRQVEDGYRYGKIGLSMLDNFKTESWLPRVAAPFYGVVSTWKTSFKEILGPIKQAYRLGLASGDIEYALLNWSIFCWTTAQTSPLPELEREIRSLAAHMEFFGQTETRSMIEPLWQAALNLMGQSKDTKTLTGEVMDQEQRIAFAKTHNPGLLLWIGFYRAWIEYLLGDYDAAEKNCAGVEEIFDSGYGAMDASEVMLYLQLILLAQARRGKRGRLRKCRRLLRRLRAWSLHGPHSMLGKLFLVEAELAGCEGKPLLAKSKYISSILHLREEGMLGQEALANELLCNHCLRLGQEEDAVPYFHEACRLTEKWGAVVKLKYMHDKVGPLLL